MSEESPTPVAQNENAPFAPYRSRMERVFDFLLDSFAESVDNFILSNEKLTPSSNLMAVSAITQILIVSEPYHHLPGRKRILESIEAAMAKEAK